MKTKKPLLRIILTILLLIFIFTGISLLLNSSNAPKELAYSGSKDAFVEQMENGNFEEVFLFGDKAYAIKKPDKTLTEPEKKYRHNLLLKKRADYVTSIGTTHDFQLDYRAIHPSRKPLLTIGNPANKFRWTSYIFPVLGLFALGFMMYYLYKQNGAGSGGALNFVKNKAKLMQNVNVKFDDVAGAEEEKEELKEIVEFLKNPGKFKNLGAKIPRGVLLVGPPGTGKTLFAKAIAGEANVPFFSTSGSEFVEMFVGAGAARVRDLFTDAKKNAPCIVFIDEIDAVGRQRGAGLGGGNDEKEQTLNQLLVEMDGFQKDTNIIILAATNRADVLDPALVRPGRFDRQIYVNVPDVKGREAIFKVHSRNKPLADDVSFEILARMTTGFTGADIENLLNEAAILAARANRNKITMVDILEGINKVIIGQKKKSRVITDYDKKITAYHESGHAIIAHLLPLCDQVQEVSIIPRGMAAGYTLTRPDNDNNHVSKNALIQNITMMLGGRAAEELVIGDITTGASNDIERATSVAKQMVTQWGMSLKIGTMSLGGEGEVFLGRDYTKHSTTSDGINYTVDLEIKEILDTCYAQAKDILKKNMKVLHSMSEVLLKKDTIYTSEVELLFEGKSSEEVIDIIDEKIKNCGSDIPRLEIIKETNPEAETKPSNDNTAKKEDVIEIVPEETINNDTEKQFFSNSFHK